MKNENGDRLEYTSDDDLFPTEITFSGGLRIRLGCSEDGKSYLKVESP